MFNVWKQPGLVSDGSSLAQKPQLDTRTETGQGGRKSSGMCLSVPLPQAEGGPWETLSLMC